MKRQLPTLPRLSNGLGAVARGDGLNTVSGCTERSVGVWAGRPAVLTRFSDRKSNVDFSDALLTESAAIIRVAL